MSLKKALGKLKTGSNPPSDEESSPVGRSPKPNGHNNHSSPIASPRSSGIFARSSGTFARHSLNLSQSPNRTNTLREKLGFGDDESSDSVEVPLNRDGEPISRNQARKLERQAEQEKRRHDNEERELEIERRRKELEEKAAREESAEMRARYGDMPINGYAGEWKHEPRAFVRDLSKDDLGKEVIFRARIHNLRKMSAKLVFFLFRQQTATIQGVLQEHGNISPYFVYWAEHLDLETIVLVKGIVQEPKAKEGEVISATVHDVEISVHSLHVEAKLSEHLPFNVQEAEIANAEIDEEKGDKRTRVSDRARLVNRIIDLRTTTSQSIFRIQAGICNLFRSYLDAQGFMEIHTPKLQGGATESGASVFKLNYFGRPGFLAQSPQLAKQMSIAADFGRVYEIGAVFRAENSNTHRHLTEFTGLDLEMAIDEHYHEVLMMLDNTFKHIFKGIYERYRFELDSVKRHFPHDDLVWLDETPRIPFREAVKMLNDSGWRDEDGKELPETEDLGTRDEIQFGKLMKEKYKTDFYIIDKFPASARPFYTMPDPEDPEVTNSFDIFLRGQEILSGGQRIHDAKTLLAKMERLKVDPNSMEDYISGFEWGAPPHGGGGIGLERMLFLLLNLGNVRLASMYPRDPKSLPQKPAVKELRHPEASTTNPPWQDHGKDRVLSGMDYQPLEKLIANYGDATNTSWLEPRTEIWRDELTGAAIGFVPQDGFGIVVGEPLCHPTQYLKTITAFLRWLKKERGLKPLWLLVGPDVEEVLATKFNWRTFSVTADQRVDLENNKAQNDAELKRKIRHAEREGVKVIDIPIGTPVPEEIRNKVDGRIKDWLANRKGKQVHLTDIRPWQDMEHRQYAYALDGNGTICAFVAVCQLAPDHGWQVKYTLDFPGSPSGAIEMIVTHVLKKLADLGVPRVTFGGGASSRLTPGHNLKGTKIKMLSKAYHAIATELKLTNKSEFREKLGAHEDPNYVCYPPHGLGPSGVRAILNFFEDEP
ncbi:hypothetical protein BDY21DRAFT_281545 [Lineolata rhizophorae]|uniref:Aspartate--tRNA ligase, cytoplasmic n=1 Tax=Lineolata rhizophorae TaxID=578093 RepID=A0A6A6P885_9PEZI|nr:hypothetical protein BDY21DRAFT_281545 [Lineolata rhizophorae]